jgi:hypothetical protein
MSEMKKCAHECCGCMTTEKYCSEVCKDAGKMIELNCHCHHPGCTGGA